MSAIRTTAAASMLGVSPNTLRSWERRFGFPAPARSTGGHRQYELAQIEALRQALEELHNVSSAISVARERGEGPSSAARLVRAYGGFEEERANRLLEESLVVRSVERTIDELLLPAVGRLASSPGSAPSPEYETAWRHATGWLSAQRRLAPQATRPEGVLVFDASAALDLEALHVQALEIALRRAGLRTLTLTLGTETARLGHALRALAPDAVVFAGGPAQLDTVGRLVYAVRAAAPGVDVLDFRDSLPGTGASTVGRLGAASLSARDALLARLGRRSDPTGRVLGAS
ncbi:MAG: MerR family transcriptional regulator, light-induced transcriptional regulator [Solirubrobacteraceae bacterium]|jgi:DNA-binding transcriptional MerR regulator|nr:MerR family transcriptional regulator, light-induced transcriptional regulator [Solirubrobacteraceae bacterium]